MEKSKNTSTIAPLSKDLGSNVEELIKYQALALSNRLNVYKKNYKELKHHCSKLETSESSIKIFLKTFEASWMNFIESVKSDHNLLSINDSDEQAKKIISSSETLKESFTEVFENKSAAMLAEKSKNSLDSFFKVLRGVYTGIRLSHEKLEAKLLADNSNTKPDEKLAQQNKELKKKIEEYENQVNNLNSKLSDLKKKTPSAAEYENLKEKVGALEESLEDTKELNEHLNRRLRYLVQKYMQWTEGTLDLEDDETQEEMTYTCTCGGKLFEQLFAGVKNVPKPSKNSEMSIEGTNSKTGGQEADTKMEEEKAQAHQDYLSLTEKVQQLEKQLEELLASKLKLSEENIRYKIEQENIEEKVFKSKLFNTLVSQTQEVLRMCTYLKGRAISTSNTLESYEEQRRSEMARFVTDFTADRGDLLEIVERLKQAIEDANVRVTQRENELLQEYDLNTKTNNLLKIIEDNDKRYDNLNKENMFLRSENKKIVQKLDETQTKLNKVETEVSELNIQNLALKQRLPEATWENISFRHQKHKEFLSELQKLNTQNQLGIKEKVEDLRLYIKTREEKIESLEKKLKNLTAEVEKEKNQTMQLIQEVELNSQISEDIQQKSNQLRSQIAAQNENFAKLVKEKHIEKASLDGEKMALSSKLKLKEEECQNLKKLTEELKEKCAQEESLNKTLEEGFTHQKSLLQENKNTREELLRKIEELKTEIGLDKEKIDSLEKLADQKTKEVEETKIKLNEKQDFINKRLTRAKDLTRDANEDLSAEDVDTLLLEVKRYRKMLTCSVCQTNEKSVVLTKCFHTFCRKCIDTNIQVRDRKCPTCRVKFNVEYVEKLWME